MKLNFRDISDIRTEKYSQMRSEMNSDDNSDTTSKLDDGSSLLSFMFGQR
eukprot:CAMPEP_0202974812 /NCGR_PEP_ID=MMETSP1396-20130829/64181_1 /ASSEMBLY_ACC=CAM_ASM_000872 /TAXON_ID= /ORGANISM="Pseudokeronopsis sp., Strain Brazil" /LENGTH=49 /DNA_ID=CAMNT_0049709379 /DNA_START=62 /DNA_END=211 /DNA_ORIENTATION=+